MHAGSLPQACAPGSFAAVASIRWGDRHQGTCMPSVRCDMHACTRHRDKVALRYPHCVAMQQWSTSGRWENLGTFCWYPPYFMPARSRSKVCVSLATFLVSSLILFLCATPIEKVRLRCQLQVKSGSCGDQGHIKRTCDLGDPECPSSSPALQPSSTRCGCCG